MAEQIHFSKEDIERYYDKALSPEKEKEVQGHLQSCERCSSYLESLKDLSGVLRTSFSIAPEKDFARSVMQKIKGKHIKEKETKGIFDNIFILFQRNKAVTALAASVLVILLAVFAKNNTSPGVNGKERCLVDYVHAPEGSTFVYDAEENMKVVWVFDEGAR